MFPRTQNGVNTATTQILFSAQKTLKNNNKLLYPFSVTLFSH